MKQNANNRAAVYIDGFNLYYGLRDRGWKKYYWLDMLLFSQNLVKHRELVSVKYFTAHIKGSTDKSQRQQCYLDALRYHCPNVEIIKGRYLQKKIQCRACGNSWNVPEEKKTDVNIATHMLTDAMQDLYDDAFLISADSDLVPPIEMISSLYPTKSTIVAFPPKRKSQELRKKASRHFDINEVAFRVSQLPNQVKTTTGALLTRPPQWR